MPSASKSTVTSWQSAIGAMLSSIVTFDTQVLVLPLVSVTNSGTVCTPTSPQPNSITEGRSSPNAKDKPQASLDPASNCAGVRMTAPPASNCRVRSWQEATGAMLSSTVTIAVQVLVLPCSSSAVTTTVFEPTSAQSNALISSVVLARPQPSDGVPTIWAGVMLANPSLSSCTVMPWQSRLGAVLSSTVTVAVQVLVLPLLSSTVNVTSWEPTSAQSKMPISMATLARPQASLEPLFT